MTKYRKLYTEAYGPIPKDNLGRSYEIHHIDGNHSNNDITNLKCVSIEEHYNLHLSQGDYAACKLIFARMQVVDIEIQRKAQSNLSRKNCFQMVKNGTHPFLGGEIQKETNKKRILAGTHNFTSEYANQRVKDGTNPFLYLAKNRHKNGTNHLTAKVKCEHCDRIIDGGNYRRWHGDKCKLNI